MHSPSVEPPKFISQQVVDARRFYLNLRPRVSREMVVICGGWERCAPDYQIDRASFPYLTLEFVAAGRGSLTLAGKTHPLRAGSVFAYGGPVAHQITTDPTHRLTKYFVNFVGQRAKTLQRECGIEPGRFRNVTLSDTVQKAFEDLLHAGQRPHGSARVCTLYLEILFLAIAEAGEPSAAISQRAFLTFTRCRQYLEENFHTISTVEQAAAACHLDVAYVCRLFARFARQSPFHFLQRLKMNHAASLLETGQCLVREAADALDMDPFHFSRTFKRVHGISPSAFMTERMRLQRNW